MSKIDWTKPLKDRLGNRVVSVKDSPSVDYPKRVRFENDACEYLYTLEGHFTAGFTQEPCNLVNDEEWEPREYTNRLPSLLVYRGPQGPSSVLVKAALARAIELLKAGSFDSWCPVQPTIDELEILKGSVQ